TFRYTPDTNFVGDDSFTYQISDGRGGSDTAEVIITVTQGNRLPVANDDSASTANTQVLQGSSVLANDSDPDGDELTIDTVPVSAPSHGTLVINPDGTFRYTPNASFIGDDSFTYQISDGRGGSATAEVTITVTQGNRAPVARDDRAILVQDQVLNGENLLANDSDPEGDALSINTVPIVNTKHGTLVINADGSFIYTPNGGYLGTDTFTYQLMDSNGSRDTANVIIVIDVNRQPVASDYSVIVARDQVYQGASLLSNASDPNGDRLVVSTTPAAEPSQGTLVLREDGTFRYMPNSGFEGFDSFTYQVIDSHGSSSTGTVIIVVTASSIAVTPETPETPVSVSPTPVPETPTPEPSTLETPTPVGPTPEIPVPETPMPNDGNHDKDNDGIPDDVEGQGDMDGDMIPNSEDEDSDGDGTPDRIEGIVDANQNGLRDFLDPSINTVAYLPISGVQTRDE
ncbi:MAG: Ig-like domain-containing protein, partial [Chloroflexota bacterium]